MPTLKRLVTTHAPAEGVFAYLSDFANAAEWDSGTVACERISGDGGPGTTYRNRSRFAGREVELIYTVEENAEPVLVIVGKNATTVSRDTIIVTPTANGGSSIEYTAEFTFSGPARFLGPLMQPLLARLGDATAAQLARVLDAGASQ